LYGEWDGIAVYVDDAVLWSKKKPGESEESVIKRLMQLLDRFTKRLADRNITLSIERSSFFQHSIDFLGFRLGRDGISVQKQKQAAIVDAPHPSTPKELHTFIGTAVWLQKCLKCNTAELLKPLRKYVIQRATDKSFINKYDPDDPEVRQAVELTKAKVAASTTLHSPRWHCGACIASQTAPNLRVWVGYCAISSTQVGQESCRFKGRNWRTYRIEGFHRNKSSRKSPYVCALRKAPSGVLCADSVS
jgi:hypothetical protein